MSTSQFCLQQRQREQQNLKKILLSGFVGSTLLHGVLALTIHYWSFQSLNKTEKPIELVIVNKSKLQPKVETKPIVEPKPQPKIEPEPIIKPKPEPQPQPKPEPVKTQTPPPPIKQPEPVKTQAPPPQPTPQRVLTNPNPQPLQPLVTAAPSVKREISNSFNSSANTSSNSNGTSEQVAATNSVTPPPQPKKEISCLSNCKPEYPSALAGIEGNAVIKLTLDANGNVTSASIATPSNESQINRQALLAARQMKFSSPGSDNASVQVKINFTVAGSEYDRLAREQQRQRELAEQKRKEQETARKQQLERERQAQQEQQRREQAEIQQQQQPVKPLTTPSITKTDEEMLREFRQRIEQHQQQDQ